MSRTLQDRVLEAIGEKGIKPRQLYDAMQGELLSSVDLALRGLIKDGRVVLRLGEYQRVPGAPAPPMATAGSDAPNPAGKPIVAPQMAPTAAQPAASNERPKGEAKPPQRRPEFSPRLTALLVEHQRHKAEELQNLLARVTITRKELADIEDLVRIATAEGAA